MTFGNRLDRFSVLAVLVAMGVTRPLLDLLGDNAEFFLARRSPGIDVVAVGIALGIGLPLLVGMAALPNGRLGKVLFLVLTFLLSTTLVRLFLVLTPMSDSAATLGAVIGGLAMTWALTHWQGLHQVARLLLPAPVLFTVLFFFFTPTASVLAGETSLSAAGSAATAVPLVWVVFDELPAASLMDSGGDIYAERYPNFGRLAADGLWFPNAVTVEQQTEHSVPAILTGVKPAQDLTPYAGQYPNNIFIALSESHDLAVYESVTHLCPASLCNTTETIAPADVRAELLASDLAIVAGHTLLPRVLSDGLPPINQGWGYFGQQVEDFDAVAEFWDAYGTDPRSSLADATSRIERGFDGRPPFLFVHALVPHHPWQLLPTGQRYPLTGGRTPGTTSTGWGSNEWLINQGLQRHLINVGYADHALGLILDALDEAGLYEEAMVVVVADHGIAIKQDVEHQRTVSSETIGEIAAVPILIKVPDRPGGQVDHRRALTVDLVPTVAEVMGIDLAWQPDGRSLLGRDPGQVRTTTDSPSGAVTYGIDGTEVLQVAERLATVFPDPDLFALVPPGAPDVLGERVNLATLEDSGLRLSLTHADWYDEVDPSGDVVPVWVMGRIIGRAGAEDIYAIVVNGRVAALSRSYLEEDSVRIQAMIPPEALIDGENVIDLARWKDGRLEAVETIR